MLAVEPPRAPGVALVAASPLSLELHGKHQAFTIGTIIDSPAILQL
jgi:hypothetical protein